MSAGGNKEEIIERLLQTFNEIMTFIDEEASTQTGLSNNSMCHSHRRNHARAHAPRHIHVRAILVRSLTTMCDVMLGHNVYVIDDKTRDRK